MTHCIDGFIADTAKLLEALADYEEAHILVLDSGNLAFVPLTYELETALPKRFFRKQDFPVATISTDYFGGGGTQRASVRHGNAFLLRRGQINNALAILGVSRTQVTDEFDMVGLGKWRTNDAWVQNAPHARPRPTVKFPVPEDRGSGSCGEAPIRVFLLHHMTHAPYFVFGTDAVEAAKPLAAKLGCSTEDFGVGGSWPITEPINLGQLWPYFTNDPSEKMLQHGKEKRQHGDQGKTQAAD